ncbi:MAG: ABC transporter permease, partial [Thermoplasmata archaeon]|nr:ABC transporter permease [Thermoplasmata archaeon]
REAGGCPVNGRRIYADFKVFVRGYLRNPIGLFFSLFFPIILVSLFGLIFSAGATAVTLYVENNDHPSAMSAQFLEALNATGAVKVQLWDPAQHNHENFSQWLANNSDPVGLVIPSGFAVDYQTHSRVNLTLYVNPQDQVSSGIATAAVGGVGNAFSFAAANATPLIGVSPHPVGSQLLKSIDYLVPGLVGFSILTSPMFSMVDISASYRKDGLFRQLSLTPLTKGEWLAAKILWYIVLTFVSAAIMVAIGVYGFGAHVTLSLGLLPFLLLGPFFFVSLGMLAGSVAKTPETAAVIGNVITFPMMFLSGTFFPVSLFPPALQNVAHFLPLFYVIDGMNRVMLFDNFAGAIPDIGLIAVASVLVFIAAILAFRWRDE